MASGSSFRPARPEASGSAQLPGQAAPVASAAIVAPHLSATVSEVDAGIVRSPLPTADPTPLRPRRMKDRVSRRSPTGAGDYALRSPADRTAAGCGRSG